MTLLQKGVARWAASRVQQIVYVIILLLLLHRWPAGWQGNSNAIMVSERGEGESQSSSFNQLHFTPLCVSLLHEPARHLAPQPWQRKW